MHQRNGIGARTHAGKRNQCRVIGMYGGAPAVGIFAAVREKAGIGRHAHEDIALGAAQARNANIERGRSGCSFSYACLRGDSNRQAQGQYRTFCPKT